MILYVVLLLFLVLILGTAFVLLTLALLLYRIPVDITARAKKEGDRFSASLSLEWGIIGVAGQYREGLWEVRLQVIGYPVLSRTGPGVHAPPVPERALRMPDIGKILGALQQCWPGIVKIVSALFRNLTYTWISCRIRYGAPDAATTGRIFGYCAAILPLQCLSDRVCVEILPVFDREILEGSGQATFRIHHPLLICIPVVQMLLDGKTRQALSQVRQGSAAV